MAYINLEIERRFTRKVPSPPLLEKLAKTATRTARYAKRAAVPIFFALATGGSLVTGACAPTSEGTQPTPIVTPDKRPTIPPAETTIIPALPTATVERSRLEAIPISYQSQAEQIATTAKNAYDSLPADKDKVNAVVLPYVSEDGKVYITVATENGKLYILNGEKGKLILIDEWQTTSTGERVRGSFSYLDGVINYYRVDPKNPEVNIDGPVLRINRFTGEVEAVTTPTPRATPTTKETATPPPLPTASSTATRITTATATETQTQTPTRTRTLTPTRPSATDTPRPPTNTPVPTEVPKPPTATPDVQPGRGEVYENREIGTRMEIHNGDPRFRIFPVQEKLAETLALIQEFGKKDIVVYVKSTFNAVDYDENGVFVEHGQTICGMGSKGCIYHRENYDAATGRLKIFMYVHKPETVVNINPNNQKPVNTVNLELTSLIIIPGNPGKDRADRFYFSGVDGWLFDIQLTP